MSGKLDITGSHWAVIGTVELLELFGLSDYTRCVLTMVSDYSEKH